MKYHLLMCLWLACFAGSAQAQQFSPPEKIDHSGKTYVLAYKNVLPSGRAIYEYTTNNEAVEKWSSLITLNYLKSLVATPGKWAQAIKASLDREKPKPSYGLYLKGSHGYAKIVFEPGVRNRFYEADVYKSFHIEACDGVIVYQFARRYPPSVDQTDGGKLATWKKIASETSQVADALEKSSWTPTCN